jgi:transposase
VLRLMRGEPVEGVSRRLGVAVWKLERWRERALAGSKPRRSAAEPVDPCLPLRSSRIAETPQVRMSLNRVCRARISVARISARHTLAVRIYTG